MNYGAYTWGDDIYGNIVPTVRIAFGTLAAWNALTQAQRDSFDGGHYLTLKAAVDVHPGAAAIATYYYEAISDTTNSQRVTLPPDTSNNHIQINGGGFVYDSTTSLGDIYYTNGHGNNFTISVFNFRVTFSVAKASSFDGFVYLNSAGSVSAAFYLSRVIGNSGCGAAYRDSNANFFVYANVVENCDAGIYYNGGAPTVILANNTCYGNSVYGIDSQVATARLLNNNCSTNGVSDINGTYVDEGGNVTSDTTGSPGFTNVTNTNAMIDPVGGDYRPIASGPLEVPYVNPIIDEDTNYINGSAISQSNSYAGAFGAFIASVGLSGGGFMGTVIVSL